MMRLMKVPVALDHYILIIIPIVSSIGLYYLRIFIIYAFEGLIDKDQRYR
jgi:hypothetical protein